MGLAAGQARLLTITGRKSDCEFESMRLSHQKIALARQLADLSNEYQNSLTQTKLVYDYYGTGDTTTPLSYGILMQPSALNNYMPITLTDSMGRVCLNSKLAAAAFAAGIPQEGLGTLPSELMRNNFINQLAEVGMITPTLANTITGLPYNQTVGFGGGATVAIATETGNIDKFIEFLSNNGSSYLMDSNQFPTFERTNAKGKPDTSIVHFLKIRTDSGYYNKSYSGSKAIDGIVRDNNPDSFDTRFDGAKSDSFTLAQLLSGKKDPTNKSSDSFQYFLGYSGISGEQSPVYGVALMQDIINGGFLDWIGKELSEYLDLGDAYTSHALEYAANETYRLLNTDDKRYYERWRTSNDEKRTDEATDAYDDPDDAVRNYLDPIGTAIFGKCDKDEYYQQGVVYDSKDYIGFTYVESGKGGGDDGNDHSTAGINLNNIAKVYLTYFADFMNGAAKTDVYGNQEFDVNIGKAECVHLCTNNDTFEYTWKVGSEVSSDDLGQATFYDALFNQICYHGWTENNRINDNEYLQDVLHSGMLYVSKIKDDGYYYQGNYATDNYIKEVPDESLIAQAEAKYNTEKAKLNAKEETLDMKMKNLDTEISSLTTEYDTVKNTISKQIEKCFKRYNA